MNPAATDTQGSPVGAEIELEIPPRLLAVFEKTERQLRELYGTAPDVPSLVRLWLTCATVSRIRKEFEAAVQELDRGIIDFDHEDEEDGDDL